MGQLMLVLIWIWRIWSNWNRLWDNSNNQIIKLSKIRVKGREKYPARTFGTSSAYIDCAYFPSASSFYSIVDSKNEHTIIPFGSGSKLSCDATSNFFTLRTDGLEPERYYNVLFKIESGSGATKTVQFIDNDFQFKVVQ